MDAARSVVATFTLNQYALTVTVDGAGSGTVTSSPAGHRLRLGLRGALLPRDTRDAHADAGCGLVLRRLGRRLHGLGRLRGDDGRGAGR